MYIKSILRKFRNRLRRVGLKTKVIPYDGVRFFGTEYGGFSVISEGLSSDSIVYSFGIGEDISFDIELINEFGCKVIGFDPTPKSLKWLENQTLPEGYSYQPVGLAAYDGVMTFAMPYNDDYVSISSVLEEYEGTRRLELPVKRLKTLMQEYNHKKIDILKMDIEGSEYAVIQDILKENLEIGQILVEFHHRFKGIGIDKTNLAIKSLEAAGYGLFAVADSGEEMSFIRKLS